MVGHADSATLAVTTESHVETDEIVGARKDTTGTLTAVSGRQSETASHVQTSMDVEETHVSLTRTS